MSSWKERFYAPCYPWSEVARGRPERGVLVKGNDLMAWDVDTGDLRPLVHRPHGVVLFAINRMIDPLGRWVYYLDDDEGNEIGHLARIPYEGGDKVDLTPELPPYTIVGLSAGLDGRRVALNLATAEGFRLLVLDTETLETRELHRSPREFIRATISACGKYVSVMSTEWTGNRHYGLVVFDTDSGTRAAELWDDPESNFHHGLFSPNRAVMAVSGLKEAVRRPLLWDPLSGKREWLPLNQPTEVTPLDWSPDGESLLLSSFRQGSQSLYLYSLSEKTTTPINHEPGSFGEYGGTFSRYAYFADSLTVHAHRQTALFPLRLEAYTPAAPPSIVIGGGYTGNARPWESVTFPSSEGTEVQAWLGLPEGEGPHPTVISIHGGPHLVQTETFCPASQAWMDHGFIYLSLNYRGSTTFGSHFQEQIWGRLGQLELEDLVAARRFLIESGHTDAEQVYLAGESYGAFLTLFALGRRPELWAGGLAAVALTDWTETYRDASGALQGAFRNWFGGSPEEVPERYRESSPVHLVDRIQAPVLLYQGKNDSRTPPRQARLFEKRMREAGKQIEVHWFDGGHAMDSGRKMELQQLMLDFVARHGLVNAP